MSLYFHNLQQTPGLFDHIYTDRNGLKMMTFNRPRIINGAHFPNKFTGIILLDAETYVQDSEVSNRDMFDYFAK